MLRVLIACLLAIILAACGQHDGVPTPAIAEPDHLSLHWVADGLVQDIRTFRWAGTGEPIELEAQAVLGMEHFTRAAVVRDPATSQYSVEVQTTTQGRRRLDDQTSRNVGRALAVVLGNRVMALPTVMAPLETGVVPLEGFQALEQADSVAELVNAGIRERAQGG